MAVEEGVVVKIGKFVFSEFMSNNFTDGMSWSKEQIKKAVNDKHDQSLSTKIYRVIEVTLNSLTGNKYKDSDILYKAVEKIFIEFKNGKGEVEAVKAGLGLVVRDVTDSRCKDFIEKFDEAVCQDEELFKRRSISLQKREITISENGFQQIGYKIDSGYAETNKKLDILSEKVDNKEKSFISTIKIESRTQEYLDKWNENMFLNNFSEWDENAGINIKLSDVYIGEHLPHFTYGKDRKEFTNLNELLSKYMESSYTNKTLLILGQPGIGKSTLITWMINNFKDRVDDILVYKFASDLKDVNWQSSNDISKIILDNLGLDIDDLNEKIFILDGFDEVDVKDKREYILNKICEDVKNFTLIITCRENYIDNFRLLGCEYITLQPWDKEQIESFCNIYCEENKSEISNNSIENIIKNKDILGIPLILYMTLALNIDIEKENSIIDIYDKIFSIDGGIYDRCIENKKFAEFHRIGEVKKQIHQVSKKIAFWIFENNSEEAVIPQEEYQKICRKESGKKGLEQDFIIGNFYKLKHCDGIGTNELCFIHRSIYEYFVVEYIFSSMCEVVASSEKLAGVFGYFLKKGLLTNTMREFLKYKINNSKLKNKFDIIKDSFDLMLQDGMTYHTNMYYKKVINCEMNVFTNMLEILHLWDIKSLKFNNSFYEYLRYSRYRHLNLIKIDMNKKENVDGKVNLSKGVNLNGVCLKYADLSEAGLSGAELIGSDLEKSKIEMANLSGANLKRANLKRANLAGANLSRANLVGANLSGITLIGVNLEGAVFDEYQVKCLEGEYNLNEISVYLGETNESVNYKDYKDLINHSN